ncbi:uncharacterized protein PAC_14923 [Phialocephala subalpina]|uniref:Uncharacterized protein n=1 Tax=Phialocephala subalpina TaxID=576137 RepID=A0A1L7XJ26_9HELO|nr:uncharacterized protein PAC_14923 [Phialocephala subalpina]
METVNNIASAASRVIWGENTTATNETAGSEPVSGQTGDVKAGEPYDKGNEETKTSSGTFLDHRGKDESSATSNPTSTTADTTTTSDTTSTKPTPATEDTSLSDNSGAPPAPSSKTQSASDPTTDPTAQTTSKAADTTNTTSSEDNEGSTSEDKKIAEDGIQETHSGKGDDAKFDSFKTADGPHIDVPESDGRVGPDVPKGTMIPGTEDVNDDAEAKGKSGHSSEATGAVGGEVKKAESASRESVDSAGKGSESPSGGKEKVSLKDKIKAKLHKDKN